jgi:CheY-like chemotaxis protein
MKPYVLILDDNKLDRYLLKKYFDQLGYIPILEEDPFSAYELIKNHPIDLLLIDVQMPGMNGYEFVKEVKSHHLTKAPIIMMSGVSLTKEHIIKAVDTGADQFLAKPIDYLILSAKIEQLVKNRKKLFSLRVPQNTDYNQLRISLRFRVIEVSEMGMIIEGPQPLIKKSCLELSWLIPDLKDIPCAGTVHNCTRIGNSYRSYISFLGMNQSSLKQLRLKMWELYRNGTYENIIEPKTSGEGRNV